MRHGRISKRTARGLRALRERIAAAGIPRSVLDERINVATWNIREFGRRPRQEASIHLIAEILNQFDLVAITEVRDDVQDLARVLHILGDYWKVVFSDFITDPGGNRERIAYVYDKRAVTFTGLASEADPPRRKVRTEYVAAIGWWRSPYMASFRAGSFDFMLIAAHVRWGDSLRARERELDLLARWVADRRDERHVVDKDIIVLGDFNIPQEDDALFRAVTSRGLRIPEALRGLHGTNLARNKRYDQILHYSEYAQVFTDRGGVLDFYRGDHRPLFPGVRLSKQQFTYELSDHLPLWMQLNVDREKEELDQILRG